MRAAPVIACLLVLALSIVSTTFSLLSLKSKEWASQAYYFYGNSNPTLSPDGTGQNSSTRVCVGQRSPFYRCGLPRVYQNQTCEIPDCTWYSPKGYNQTSCRTATEFGEAYGNDYYAAGLLGTEAECQQVHYAGNLQIAASLFTVLGLLIAVAFALVTLSMATARGLASQHERKEGDGAVSDSYQRSRSTPYVTFVLLICLYAGALMQILAQYFAILGLTVDASLTPDVLYGERQNQDENYYSAQNWVIGRGLSTYATVTWTSSLLCAAVATSVFRTPRFPKLLSWVDDP